MIFKHTALFIIGGLSLLSIHSISFSQPFFKLFKNDSLEKGRECKIVLFNAIEAEGKVLSRKNDTIKFEVDNRRYSVPVKDIRFVLKLRQDVSTREVEKFFGPAVKDTVPDATDECDIYFSDRSVLTDINMAESTDTTLTIYKVLRKKEIPYTDIRKIVFKSTAPFGKGYLIGSAIGFAIGFIPFLFSESGGHPSYGGPAFGLLAGIALSIPVGLIGGVIGVLSDKDEVYNFNNGDYPNKFKRIKKIINKHRL